MIARAIAISSSACRSRIERATASPDPAAAKTTGDSSASRRCARVPASILRVTSIGRATPNRAGTSFSSVGPRPSSVACPHGGSERRRPDVVPAAPIARDVAERGEPRGPPVGAIPAALTPWPQMSATPQPCSAPARIGVKASLTTTTSVARPRRPSAAVSRRVSAGVSAPASPYTPTWAAGASGGETGRSRAGRRPARPSARSPARSRSAGATSSVRAARPAAVRRCRRARGRSSNSRRRRRGS